MKHGYNYHCIRCKCLIASANKPLDVPAICSNCENKDTLQAIALQNSKLKIDFEKQKELKAAQYQRKKERNAKKK